MSKRDFYEILGVTRKASADDRRAEADLARLRRAQVEQVPGIGQGQRVEIRTRPIRR